ncbi:agmatinase [Candidatus Nomurabacteria bacterium]|nr:agmatinase [Candidatus Nomurabacteria bacterium]
MIDTIINQGKNTKNADAVIISACYEKTASSRKGTATGPKAILKMLDSKLELFDRKYKKNISQYIKIAEKDLGNISSLSPQKALEKITNECGKLLDQDKFVFLLGGEHSVSLGLLTALSKKYSPKNVTVFQIDAHCDLRNDDSDYSDDPTNLAHSCVLRRTHELGYNLVQVGIRTYSKMEYDYFTKNKKTIKVFEWGKDSALGAVWKEPAISDIIKSIKTKYVYITIDVDGFDPAHMPGTGTPVQGGLEWWYGVKLLDKVSSTKELIGADIVEVSPQKETVLTEYGSAQLLYSMVAHKFRNRLK